MRWIVVALAWTFVACGAVEAASVGTDGSVDESIADSATVWPVDGADVQAIDAGPYEPWQGDAECVHVGLCPNVLPAAGSACTPYVVCSYGMLDSCGMTAVCGGPVDGGAWKLFDAGPCAPVVVGGSCPTSLVSSATSCGHIGTICVLDGGTCRCGNDPSQPTWDCRSAPAACGPFPHTGCACASACLADCNGGWTCTKDGLHFQSPCPDSRR